MELSNQEKQAILEQRLKQFAVEKYNHEINKELITAQEVGAKGEAKEQLTAEVAKTDEAIAIIDKAIATTQSLIAELPVEVKEAEVVTPVTE
jgi:hypothetical protein